MASQACLLSHVIAASLIVRDRVLGGCERGALHGWLQPSPRPACYLALVCSPIGLYMTPMAAIQHSSLLLRTGRCQPFTTQRLPRALPSLLTASCRASPRQQRRRQQQQLYAAGGGEGGAEAAAAAGAPAPTASEPTSGLGPRDDDVLPDSLTDALEDASEATVLALGRGVNRCVVEILLPEFWDPLSGPVYAEEGDQQRFWKLTRRFLENLARLQPGAKIRAIYPDVGVSAMLENQWTDATFAFASLNDRLPVQPEDEIVVLAAPDPQGLQSVTKICSTVGPEQALVMFNPRLASGDVGVGLNMRRMREELLGGFSIVYSLRPVGDVGSVFRRYPGLWQVFVQDEAVPGRYRLAAERVSRPGGEALDLIIMEALGGGTQGEGEQGEGRQGPGLVDQALVALKGLNRFMRQLSQ